MNATTAARRPSPSCRRRSAARPRVLRQGRRRRLPAGRLGSSAPCRRPCRRTRGRAAERRRHDGDGRRTAVVAFIALLHSLGGIRAGDQAVGAGLRPRRHREPERRLPRLARGERLGLGGAEPAVVGAAACVAREHDGSGRRLRSPSARVPGRQRSRERLPGSGRAVHVELAHLQVGALLRSGCRTRADRECERTGSHRRCAGDPWNWSGSLVPAHPPFSGGADQVRLTTPHRRAAPPFPLRFRSGAAQPTSESRGRRDS